MKSALLLLLHINCFNEDDTLIHPHDNTVKEGETTSITCCADSETIWSFGFQSVPKNVKIYSNNTLVLRGAKIKNGGIYSCEGETKRNDRLIPFKAIYTLFIAGR